MVGFRNAANFTGVTNWWDNGNKQIAFGRGDRAFIVINGDNVDLDQTLQVLFLILRKFHFVYYRISYSSVGKK